MDVGVVGRVRAVQVPSCKRMEGINRGIGKGNGETEKKLDQRRVSV